MMAIVRIGVSVLPTSVCNVHATDAITTIHHLIIKTSLHLDNNRLPSGGISFVADCCVHKLDLAVFGGAVCVMDVPANNKPGPNLLSPVRNCCACTDPSTITCSIL